MHAVLIPRFAMARFAFPILLSILALCSCEDREIRTYRVATDSEPETPAPSGAISQMGQSKSQADSILPITWQAPSAWKAEPPNQFATAAYSVAGAGRVTISKLAGDGGGLAANINRWRGQVGLETLPDDQISGQPMPVPESDKYLLLFNLNPETPMGKGEGIFAAVLTLKSETWFFKFTGKTNKLIENGDAFMAFLQSIRISGSKASLSPAQPHDSPAVPEIKVTPPEGWKPGKGSSMRVASFAIKGPDETSADVSVIPLAGDSGSILENVNRWRSQIKLAPLDASDDPALGRKAQGPAGEFFISHMVSSEAVLDGKKAAISSAILKKGNITWFFKITGEASLVEANREKFEAFALSTSFP